MNKEILITGHKNPDADSICATIAYADLKAKLGFNVKPVRIGNINAETTFILNKFNIEPPQLVHDIRTRLQDISIDEALSVTADTTIQKAWQAMLENDKKVVAIVEADNTLIGLATISAITNAILSLAQNNFELIKQTPLDNIAETLLGELIVRPENYHPSGIISVGSSLLIEKEFISYKDKIVITSAREDAQLKAIHTGAALVIAALSKETTSEVIKEAKEHNCAVICTTLDIFTTAQLISQSIPINLIMTTNLVSFNSFDCLDDVKSIIPKSRYRSYPVVDGNNILLGLVSRYHLWGHDKRQVILVDHNEKSQSIDGIEQAEVIEIIDHHRIGDIQTTTPVMFRNEILGSTSTIIARMYQESNIEIPPEIAGILCGAIISDTMNFNSPTCTSIDIETANFLADIADVALEQYASELYMAAATIAGKSISDIVHTDLKEFDIDSFRIAIGQVNIANPFSITNVKHDIESYLEKLCISSRYDFAIMIFSYIDDKGSYVITAGKESFIFNLAFDEILEIRNELNFLPEILSRKKQIIPMLAKAIARYSSN